MSKALIATLVAVLVGVCSAATYWGNARLAVAPRAPARVDAALQGFLSAKPPLTGNGHGYQ